MPLIHRRDLLAGAAAALIPATGCEARGDAPAFPMRKGVNLGNALDADWEGQWGYRVERAHVRAIADAGFDGVRVPVRWDTHLEAAPPFRLDPEFMSRVAEVVAWAAADGLKAQINVHHYDQAIRRAYVTERSRFLALWRQIAEYFADAGDHLILETLNEPRGDALNAAALTELQAEMLATVRQHSPSRLLVFGGPNWSSVDGLHGWEPPARERCAVTFHYYRPFEFTHQNAEWMGANAPRFNRAWGTDDDLARVRSDMQRAAAWAGDRSISLQLGEFGVNRRALTSQRALWLRTVRNACEAEGIGWCVWDFAGTFALWDRDHRMWNGELVSALLRA